VHKFTVGQLVQFHPDRGERASAPPGLYEVTNSYRTMVMSTNIGSKASTKSTNALREKVS